MTPKYIYTRMRTHTFQITYLKDNLFMQHDRWTGYRTREKYMGRVVAHEPFTNASELLNMVSTIDRLFNEVRSKLKLICYSKHHHDYKTFSMNFTIFHRKLWLNFRKFKFYILNKSVFLKSETAEPRHVA